MHAEMAIAWVPASSSTIVRLRGLAPPRSRIVPFEDELTLLGALARGGIALTVVEAGGSTHALAIRALRRVHEAFPEQPLVAWCDFRTMHSQQLLEVARAGAQEIVRHEVDELRFVFARIMASATQRAVSARIAMALHDDIPSSLRPLLGYALEHADEHLDRDEVAAVFGVSRRTLHGRLVSAGLPPTRAFLTWCRLFVACALLDQSGHTLDSVAGQLGLSDGHTLGNAVRRYAGEGINRLRDGGALDAMLNAFRATVALGDQSAEALHSLPEPSSAD